MKVDTLIVGQGLAGSLLAWELLSRGQRVLVIDRDEPDTSSKVAAGVVSPITGKRLSETWRGEEFLRHATAAYRRIENATGQWLYRPLPLVRLLNSEEEVRRWQRKVTEAGGEQPRGTLPLEIDESLYRAELGGFELSAAGWLQVPAFLEAMRQFLLERLGYAIGRLEPEDVKISRDEVRWKNVTAERIVLCQGWEGSRNRWFDWVPFRNAKGQILDLVCEGTASEKRIVNRGGWMLPLGEGRFRAGATYEWDFAAGEASATSEESREELEGRLERLLKVPFEVTGQRAAVRPVIRRSRALVGWHPDAALYDRVGFFNGLGSKGVLNGPFIASHFADHLVRGTPLEEELDLRKNL